MHRVDSAFGRLALAWEPAALLSPARPTGLPSRLTRAPHADSLFPLPPSGSGHPSASPAAAVARVLVVRHLQRAPSLFDCGLLGSTSCEDRAYRVDSLVVGGFDELERRCREHLPRVLVLDIGLIPDAAALQHLRRRLSATDIVIGWDRAPASLDAALLAQACGCIDWALSPAQLTHALDAVIAGELWFPRAVLQSLYLALRRPDTTATAQNCAPDRDTERLTVRETDVLALMRHGMTNKQIAAHVFEKRGLHGRRQALD
jgi:DNA-binding NarL/FixJ family response regulator